MTTNLHEDFVPTNPAKKARIEEPVSHVTQASMEGHSLEGTAVDVVHDIMAPTEKDSTGSNRMDGMLPLGGVTPASTDVPEQNGYVSTGDAFDDERCCHGLCGSQRPPDAEP